MFFNLKFSQLLIGLILWLGSSFLFLQFPVTQITDGRFMLLLSNAIVFDNTTRLDEYFGNNRELKPKKDFFYWWWQLSPEQDGKVVTSHGGNWDGADPLYYRYPNLPSILSIPAVAALDKMNIKIVQNGYFSFSDENTAHRIIAALICGFIVAQIFFLAKLLLPIPWAVGLAIVSSFGTQIVSTLSRGVWSDTWAVLISLFAIHHLLSHSLDKSKIRPIFLAIISALAFYCKPNYAVIGIASVLYVVNYSINNVNKKTLFWLISAGSGFVLVFIGFSLYQFGTIIPDYYRPALELKYIPAALAGHSFSPSRGLFIYCSYLLVVIYFLAVYWKNLGNALKKLVQVSLIPIVVLIFVSSAWNTWWGGHSYGPRLIIPLLPWTILLSIISLKAFLNARITISSISKKVNYGLIIITCALSILINVHGATENKTWLEWFYNPYPVFKNPEKRLWDWADAQWLAGIKPRPHEAK